MKMLTRGDTIVEVMIVLAVLGLAISISYATANRSLLNARQAQESAEATALAQTQIEQIRANSSDATSSIYSGHDFCYKGSTFTDLTDDDPKACDSGVGISGYNPRYAVKVTNTSDTFKVVVTWDDILGEGQDTATLIYRVHHL